MLSLSDAAGTAATRTLIRKLIAVTIILVRHLSPRTPIQSIKLISL